MVVPKLRFPEFKNDWSTYLLSERVNEIIGGGTPSTKNGAYWDGNIPWFSSSDVQLNKLFNPIPTRFISNEAVTNSATSIIPQDSISIVSRVGVGKLAFIQHDYCTSQDFQSLVGFKDRPIFLSYLLQKELIKLSMMTQGTSIKGITKVELANLKINVPSISEQNKIEKLLITLDKKIQLQQEKIDLLKEQKKGFMQKIFSQELRFKDEDGQEFPEWEKGILSDLVTIIGGGTPDSQNPSFWEGEYQWYTPTEINQKYSATSARTITKLGLEKSSAKLLPVGTILLTSRATLGEMSILLNEGCTNQGFQSLVPKEQTISEFIYALQPQIKKYCYKNASGSTFLEISKSILEKMPIMIPTLKEQIKIAKFSDNIDKLIQCESDKLKVLEKQKQAFMQQMFI